MVGADLSGKRGLNFGTGAAVGAGAVVTRYVSPFTKVAEISATPVRKRFSTAVEGYLKGEFCA